MTTPARGQLILVVEDEQGIADVLRMGLRAEGFEVRHESDGPAGLKAAETARPALVLLDVMLPGMDGVEVCRRIRARSRVPVIMLTVRGELENRVEGLSAGADDYIAKPFEFEEVLARIRAVLRRSEEPASGGLLSFDDLTLAPTTREVTRGDRAIQLTAREFDLLAFLLKRPRHVLAKEAILREVWGADFYGDANVVEVYVRYLRQKLGEPQLIHTVRGVGYALRLAEGDG